MSIRCAVLFPGALGDFICFLPTLLALHAHHRGRLLLVAAPALLELIGLDEISTVSIHGREISELFAPVTSNVAPAPAGFGDIEFVYSWTGFHDADFRRHLAAASGAATGARVNIYPFRGMRSGEHAVDYYARCVGLQPREILKGVFRNDEPWVGAFRRQHGMDSRQFLVIHPGSGSPRKNWQGFNALARRWRQDHDSAVVVLHGPAERESPPERIDGAIVAPELSLPQVAALLRSASFYLGNDSGISHLAAAIGAHGVVLFGPSDPAIWSPRGDRLSVVCAPEPCVQCGPEVFCEHRLSAEVVLRSLEETGS